MNEKLSEPEEHKLELKHVDLLAHPEADLSVNAEKGAVVGGVAGAAIGAIAGLALGPGGAALGAVIGGVVGATGTGVVVAATDNQGEHHSEHIKEEADEAIERNELRDDTFVDELIGTSDKDED